MSDHHHDHDHDHARTVKPMVDEITDSADFDAAIEALN